MSLFRAPAWRNPDPGIPLRSATSAITPGVEAVWRSQPAVRQVVSFMARSIAVLPWRVFRVDDSGRTRLPQSPAERILHDQTTPHGRRVVEDLATDMLTAGTALVVLLDGEPLRVPPPLIAVERDLLGRVTSVGIHTPGQGVTPVDDLPHALVTGWSPHGYDATPPLTTLSGVLEEARDAAEWRRRLWQGAPRSRIQVVRPEGARGMSHDQRTTFAQQLRDYSEGRAGQWILMPDGAEAKAVPGQVDGDSGAAAEVRRATVAEVAAFYGVPGELVGAAQGSYSSVAAYRRALYSPLVLGPHVDTLSRALSSALIPALEPSHHSGGTIVGVLDPSDAMDGTPLERAQVVQTAVGAPVMTRAEGRAALGLPPIDGTDDLITPLNVLSGGQASPTDTGSQNVSGDAQPDDYERQHDRASSLVRKAAPRVTPTAAETQGLVNAILDLGVSEDILEDPERLVRWIEDAAARMAPRLAAAAVTSADRVLAASGTSGTFDPATIENYIGSMSRGKAEGIADAIRGHYAKAAATNADAATVRTSLREERVPLWCESALGDAAGFGGREGARASGALMKEWVHGGGGSSPRADHAAMNGERVGIEDDFSNGMRWPYDWTAGGPADILGCTCRVEYVW